MCFKSQFQDSPSDINLPSLYGNSIPKSSFSYKSRPSFEIQERRGSSSSANRFSSSPSPRTSLTERTRYGHDLNDGTTSGFPSYRGSGNETSYKIREVSSHQVISRSVGGSKMPRSIYWREITLFSPRCVGLLPCKYFLFTHLTCFVLIHEIPSRNY